ncbi:hypothetical protein ACB087_01930 [Vibrio sp. VNB-15]
MKQLNHGSIRPLYERFGQDYATRITGTPKTTINQWARIYGWKRPDSEKIKIAVTEVLKNTHIEQSPVTTRQPSALQQALHKLN